MLMSRGPFLIRGGRRYSVTLKYRSEDIGTSERMSYPSVSAVCRRSTTKASHLSHTRYLPYSFGTSKNSFFVLDGGSSPTEISRSQTTLDLSFLSTYPM